MACLHPMHAWRKKPGPDPRTGKWPITFRIQDAFVDMPVTVPCGQCMGCRLDRSRQWAIRCTHEASLHDSNCFITLTFDNEHLDPNGSLDKRSFQLFMKRLRKEYSGTQIRFFHCGEYGSLHSRPHHHAILFGFDFPDKWPWTKSGANILYRSPTLERLWPFGISSIGDVTFDSCAYVARYVTKKITGDDAAEHYGDRLPEYVTMSRRPGIGAGWYEKFGGDVYANDFVVTTKGFQARPPAYYDKLFDIDHPDEFKRIKLRRALKAANEPEDDTTRLLQREEAITAKTDFWSQRKDL